MYLSKQAIVEMDRLSRVNLVNAVSGIKPANLIGTTSKNKVTNLAIFSSVVHLGSDPALVGFILRPAKEVRRDTYNNILDTGVYTINHVHEALAERAHFTSSKFDEGVSEFEKCQIEEEFLSGFEAPFVRHSRLKLGMRFIESIPIRLNGTVLIIGEIEHFLVANEAVNEEGRVDLEKLNNVGVSGLDTYYRLEKFAEFPYARPNEIPDFGDPESDGR